MRRSTTPIAAATGLEVELATGEFGHLALDPEGPVCGCRMAHYLGHGMRMIGAGLAPDGMARLRGTVALVLRKHFS
jgi:hypothetical protein